MRKLLAVPVLVVALVALAATAGASSSSKTVKLGDDYFTPGHMTIKRGTLVTWKWTGSDPHNVTGPHHLFKSKTQTSGAPFRYRFRKAGTYTVICTIHPTVMRERITVK